MLPELRLNKIPTNMDIQMPHPAMSVSVIEKLLADRPSFHRSETEILRSFEASESCLPPDMAKKLASGSNACYAIEPDVLRFLSDSVSANSKTMETGAGMSTLIFALQASTHVAVTPSKAEISSIRDYAAHNNISLDSVRFICKPSEEFLPSCELADLDLVPLDGSTPFRGPW
jgi:hypothetical protein